MAYILWKILKEMGIPDHLTCLLRNLYAGQEATVRTGHGTIDWFQRGKGVRQGCILSPCLFNFYSECIMRNVRLNEAQAGVKIARRNINNLRYAGDTTENDKLALTKSTASDWTTNAFDICLYGDWTPCCYSCCFSTIPEGVHSGVSHTVLQGIWWDRMYIVGCF